MPKHALRFTWEVGAGQPLRVYVTRTKERALHMAPPAKIPLQMDYYLFQQNPPVRHPFMLQGCFEHSFETRSSIDPVQ
jgi:hypothetical protein